MSKDNRGIVLKKTKTIIILVSIVMIAALILTSLALAQDDSNSLSEVSNTSSTQKDNEDSKTQVTELENTSGTVRYVFAGSFDVTKDGDVIEVLGMTEEHWKKIVVPQLT